MNNEVVLRQSANASGGHVNAVVTGRAPSGSFDPEAVLKATEDVFRRLGKRREAPPERAGRPQGREHLHYHRAQMPVRGFGLFGPGTGLLAYDAPFRLARNAGDDEIAIVFT